MTIVPNTPSTPNSQCGYHSKVVRKSAYIPPVYCGCLTTAYIPVSTNRVVWINDFPLETPPRRGKRTIGAITSTIPNTQTTQPMMDNARYDFTSITPVRTRGFAGKQTIPRIVMVVAQKMPFQLLPV